MTTVGDILAYVADRLNFSENAGFSSRGIVDSFYRHLNTGLSVLGKKWPILVDSTTLTLSTTGLMALPTTTGRPTRIERITWPATWSPLEFVTPQEMNDIKTQIDYGKAIGSTQPIYWTFRPRSAEIEVQDASLTNNETITVQYSYLPRLRVVGVNYGKEQEVPIPDEYVLLLCLYIVKAMAPKENKDVIQMLYAEYNEELINIEKFRTQIQHHEVDFRPRLRF